MVDFNKMLEERRRVKSSGDPEIDDLAKVKAWEGTEGAIPINDFGLGLIDVSSGPTPIKTEVEVPNSVISIDKEGVRKDGELISHPITLVEDKNANGTVFFTNQATVATAAKPVSTPVPVIDDDLSDYEAEEIQTTGDRKVECQFITGAAGTGKTHTLREKIAADRKYAILCATTGIAGVNLGATTINSLLGYFDTESLNELFVSGRLTRKLAELSKQYMNLALDEVSMLDGAQLDTIHRGLWDVANNYTSVPHPMGLILTGDFCQLPPVKGKWAFDAQCWPEFEPNILRLTKYWRQTNPEFLNGINSVRSGDGKAGVESLKKANVEFRSGLDMDFDGTTIVSKNVAVDRYNFLALQKVKGKDIKVISSRWGKQRGEWKLIPDELHVKIGAYVMILSNDSPDFTYANGDCGHIEDYDSTRKIFHIRLVRNGNLVHVPFICRTAEQRDIPDGTELKSASWPANEWYEGKSPFKVEGRRKFGIGQVKYAPIRIAYAATVHKTQGLSLDRVQMDIRDAFFGSPGMLYVALSRCRTPEGTRVIGTPDMFAGRTKTAPEVRRWL